MFAIGAPAALAHASWELGGAVFSSRGYPMTSVHRARGDEHLDELVASWRQGSGQEVVALGKAGIGALRAIRRGRLVMMLIDQNARPDDGLFAPFFDIPARTRFGPARLAARLGVPVLPAFIHRVGETGEHIGRIHPALDQRILPRVAGGGGEQHGEEQGRQRGLHGVHISSMRVGRCAL